MAMFEVLLRIRDGCTRRGTQLAIGTTLSYDGVAGIKIWGYDGVPAIKPVLLTMEALLEASKDDSGIQILTSGLG
jgi:hypothetical protein